MTVLSLFDGMSCGVLAMMESGVPIDRYVAFEIDKYAIQTSKHNFPFIEHRGDVFKADFTEFEGFDWLIGGSPCTYWSIAQKNNRETEASGMGWELFQQYVRALHEAKPKYFIYENNKSLSKDIRQSIDEAFGFEAVLINSALVSAQNRQRLYWVGKRNDDGTYSKVDVPQPQDRGILLKDILETGCCVDKDKAYCLNHQAGNARDYFKKHHTQIKFEQVRIPDYGTDKARPINALYPNNCGGFEHRIWSENPNKQQVDMIAEPVFIGEVPEHKGTYRNGKQASQQYRVYDTNAKGVAVTTCAITNVAEPIKCCICDRNMPAKEATKQGYTEIKPLDCVDLTQPNSKTRRGRNMSKKSNCCMTSCNHYQYIGTLGFATPTEWDEEGRPIKARSCADGKIYTVYEVKDGKMNIKGKEYPIKLLKGFYIIRKLTVRECMRLQTVPEWYEFPVSDSQAYKMLGNGWTVAVISWLIDCALK